MASDVKRQALREIKYFANLMKGIIAFSDELGELADLDKEERELKASVEKLRGEKDVFDKERAEFVAQRKADMVALAQEKKDLQDAYQKERAAVLARTKLEADQIIADARTKAAKAEDAKDLAYDELEAVQKDITSAGQTLATTRALVAGAEEALKDAEKRKADIEAEVDRLRRYFTTP